MIQEDPHGNQLWWFFLRIHQRCEWTRWQQDGPSTVFIIITVSIVVVAVVKMFATNAGYTLLRITVRRMVNRLGKDSLACCKSSFGQTLALVHTAIGILPILASIGFGSLDFGRNQKSFFHEGTPNLIATGQIT